MRSMVVIRLARHGAKKAPFYDIVVTDKRNARDGRFIEKIGFYDPIKKDSKIDLERYAYWIQTGAEASLRVDSIVKGHTKQSNA